MGKLPRESGKRNARLPGAQAGGGADFLKTEHIGSKIGARATLKLLGDVQVDLENKFGARVVARVKLGTKEYLWGVRIKSRNYELLLDKFGDEPTDWKGSVPVEIKEWNGNEYIAVR